MTSSPPRPAPWLLGGEADQVDQKGRGEELGGDRVAVGVEVEVENVATLKRSREVERLPRSELGIEPGAELALGENGEAVAAAAEVGAAAGREAVDVGVDPLGRVAADLGGESVETLGVHVGDEGGDGRRPDVGGVHRRQRVAEQALGGELVVGLGPAVRGERLVGDLGGAAAGEGVVDGRAAWGPSAEGDAGALGGVVQGGAQVRVPLGVDDDGRHAGVDVGPGDGRLGDCLAGAGGADDQGVDAAVRAEGDATNAAATGGAEGEAARGEGPTAGAPAGGGREGETEGPERVALLAGLLAAAADRFVVEAGAEPDRGGGGDRENEAEAPVEEPDEVGERDGGKGPGPAQAAALESADEEKPRRKPASRGQVSAQSSAPMARVTCSWRWVIVAAPRGCEAVGRRRFSSRRAPERVGSVRARSSSGPP